MKMLAICAVFFMALVLGSCWGKSEESVTEVKNGDYKIIIRSQEFHHSAIRNIDICVAQTSSREFPKDKLQCFLHGYDFSGLRVKWYSPRNIEVSFDCGTVTVFRNWAIVSPGQSVPLTFYATLREDCDYTGSRT